MPTLEELARQANVQIGERPKNPKKERQNVLSTIARDLASPFVKVGASAYNLTSGLGNLVEGGVQKALGNDEKASQAVRRAGSEATKVRNIPFFGEVKPLGASGSFAGDVKDVVGTGLQVGSTITGGGAIKNLAGAGLKTVAKEGFKQAAKEGAVLGASYEGGRALSEDKGALDVLINTLIGGAGGLVLGGAVGATLPVLGAGARQVGRTTQKVLSGGKDIVETGIQKAKNIRNPLSRDIPPLDGGGSTGLLKDVGTVAKNKYRNVVGTRKNLALKADEIREAETAFRALNPEAQTAIKQGVELRDLQLIKEASEPDKNVFKNLARNAVEYEKNRSGNLRPATIIGEEYRKRVSGLGRALQEAGSKLDDKVSEIGGVQIDRTQTINKVLESLGAKVKGINVDEKGMLDFSRTELSGANSATARKELQQIFNDVIERANDPERLHMYRKELFADLKGKSSSGIKLVETEDKAINAMRQGMAEAIEDVAPGYREANEKVAKLITLQKETNKRFGNVNEYSDELFDERASKLLRRINSNASSGSDIAQLIQELESQLLDYGMNFNTKISNIQDFIDLLARYYDIADDDSLLGILQTANRTGVPQSSGGIVTEFLNLIGEGTQPSKATAKQAIKELLEI